MFLELLRDLKITNHPLHSHMTPDLLPHTAGTQKGTTGVFTGDSDFPYGILIVVSIGVALGVFFGGLLLSVAVMYMRRYVKRKFYTDSFLSMAIQFFLTVAKQSNEIRKKLWDTEGLRLGLGFLFFSAISLWGKGRGFFC